MAAQPQHIIRLVLVSQRCMLDHGRPFAKQLPRAASQESVMRFLNISGPGVATDEDFCPHCHVLLDQYDGDKACPLCRYEASQHGQRRRLRRKQR